MKGCLTFVVKFVVYTVLGILAIAILLAFLGRNSDTVRQAPQPSASPATNTATSVVAKAPEGPGYKIGQKVVVFDSLRPDASGVHLVVNLTDMDAYQDARRQWVERRGAHPGESQRLMYDAKKIRLYENNSEAVIIDLGGLSAKVKLTSGEGRNEVGWISMKDMRPY